MSSYTPQTSLRTKQHRNSNINKPTHNNTNKPPILINLDHFNQHKEPPTDNNEPPILINLHHFIIIVATNATNTKMVMNQLNFNCFFKNLIFILVSSSFTIDSLTLCFSSFKLWSKFPITSFALGFISSSNQTKLLHFLKP